MNSQQFDTLLHAVEALCALLTLLGSILLWVVWLLRKVLRFVTLLTDYPPHRHIGEEIAFPPDFSPGKVQRFVRYR